MAVNDTDKEHAELVKLAKRFGINDEDAQTIADFGVGRQESDLVPESGEDDEDE